jgi:hypothetical protein
MKFVDVDAVMYGDTCTVSIHLDRERMIVAIPALFQMGWIAYAAPDGTRVPADLLSEIPYHVARDLGYRAASIASKKLYGANEMADNCEFTVALDHPGRYGGIASEPIFFVNLSRVLVDEKIWDKTKPSDLPRLANKFYLFDSARRQISSESLVLMTRLRRGR